ncbi:MAG: autotransporter-associated beta strand repeat-containing protein, partial [Akkermansia sp.]
LLVATISFTGGTKAITYNFTGGGSIITDSVSIAGPTGYGESGAPNYKSYATIINIIGGTSLTTNKYQGSKEDRTRNIVNIGGDTAGKLVVTGAGVDDFILNVAGWGEGSLNSNATEMNILSHGELVAEKTILKMATDGSTLLSINGGYAKLLGIRLCDKAGKKSELRLTGGGTLNIGTSGITNFEVANDTLNWGDGTIGAWGSWTTDANISLGYRADTSTGTIATTINTAQGTDAAGYTVTLSGVISEAANKPGALIKNGAGTLVLSGANTYSGGTTVNAGTLQISNSSALGTGMTTIASGAILKTTEDITFDTAKLSMGTGSILNKGKNLTFNISKDSSLGYIMQGDGYAVTFNGGHTLSLTGVSTGKPVFNIEGQGTLVSVKGNARLYGQGGGQRNDSVFIKTGATLEVDSIAWSNGNLGQMRDNGVVLQGGTLSIATTSNVENRIIHIGEGNGIINIQSGAIFTLSNASAKIVQDGDNRSLIKTGMGTMMFASTSGDSTYAGGTIIKEGTISVGKI